MIVLGHYELEILRHTVGADRHVKKRDWGYRNRYAASSTSDVMKSLRWLESEGLMAQGEATSNLIFFHATEAGCRAAGLSKKQTARALER